MTTFSEKLAKSIGIETVYRCLATGDLKPTSNLRLIELALTAAYARGLEEAAKECRRAYTSGGNACSAEYAIRNLLKGAE